LKICPGRTGKILVQDQELFQRPDKKGVWGPGFLNSPSGNTFDNASLQFRFVYVPDLFKSGSLV
jgi:hypothetical protein